MASGVLTFPEKNKCADQCCGRGVNTTLILLFAFLFILLVEVRTAVRGTISAHVIRITR